MAGLAGKNMRLDTGSGPTHVRIEQGTLNVRTQLVETTNSESAGHEEFVFGVDGADFDATVIYTFSSPAVYALLKPGQTLAVTIYPDMGTVGSTFTGNLMVETFQLSGEVKGAIKAKITGKFTAHITTPPTIDGPGVTGTSV